MDILIVWSRVGEQDPLLFLMETPETGPYPTIILSENQSLSYILGAYKAGAWDFIELPKPNWMVELKIRTTLRRIISQPTTMFNPTLIQTAKTFMRLDQPNHAILYNDNTVPLTSMEWKILTYLLRRENQIISRPQLIHNCFYPQKHTGRVIDNHIKNIRSKLADPTCIQTVRGIGYYFNGKVIYE